MLFKTEIFSESEYSAKCMYNQKYWISRLEMVISQIFRRFFHIEYCCHHFCLSHILLFALGPTDISNVSFDILHAAANSRDSQCFVLRCDT